MTKRWVAILSTTFLLMGCSEAIGTEDEGVEERTQEEDTGDEEGTVENDIPRPGSSVYDDFYYVRGANDLEVYDGDDLQDYVGYYSERDTSSDEHVKTMGEVKENGYFTFYEVPLVSEGNKMNQNYRRAGYYLDDNMTIQRRAGLLIPWDEPVRIRSGYLAQAYGEMRLVVINDFSFTPSLNINGIYDFHPYFSGSQGYDNDPDDEFLGEAIQLSADGTLSDGETFTVQAAERDDFSEMFAMGEVRSASLIRSHLVEDAAERERMRDDMDEHEGASYFYAPQEFQLDFRFIEVITDTEEYDRYERDNTLLEMDYVLEYENESGTLLAVYGYRNHTYYQMEGDQWEAM